MGEIITAGSIWAALPLALLAGLVSFASPCVLPLVPGYLGYLTGTTTTAGAPGGGRWPGPDCSPSASPSCSSATGPRSAPWGPGSSAGKISSPVSSGSWSC